VVSSPIFEDIDDPVRHGEGGECTGFFYNTRVDVEDLVCALVIASRAKEYFKEHVRAHSVGNGCVIVGFDLGLKGGLAVFFKLSSRPRMILRGEHLSDTPAPARRLFSQSTAK
jgi:hypothetical protein